MRASYTSVDHQEQIVGANALCVSRDGARLYCGHHRCIRTFDVARPGTTCTVLSTAGRQRHPAMPPLTTIIGSVATSPDGDRLLAAGCYDRRVAVLSVADASCVFSLDRAHDGAVTQVEFVPGTTLLCTGARKDNTVRVWDLRQPAGPLFVLPRQALTNQKLAFSLYCHRGAPALISGTTSGSIVAYSLTTGTSIPEHCSGPETHGNDAVNGTSMHPALPLLATSTGQRQRLVFSDSDSSSSSSDEGEGDGKVQEEGSCACDTQLRVHRLPL